MDAADFIGAVYVEARNCTPYKVHVSFLTGTEFRGHGWIFVSSFEEKKVQVSRYSCGLPRVGREEP